MIAFQHCFDEEGHFWGAEGGRKDNTLVKKYRKGRTQIKIRLIASCSESDLWTVHWTEQKLTNHLSGAEEFASAHEIIS